MDCLVTLMGLCLFDPSGAYINTQLVSPINSYRNGHSWCISEKPNESHWCGGAIGELSIGMRTQVSSSLELEYGIRHSSYISEDDRGEESAYLSMTWSPFK